MRIGAHPAHELLSPKSELTVKMANVKVHRKSYCMSSPNALMVLALTLLIQTAASDGRHQDSNRPVRAGIDANDLLSRAQSLCAAAKWSEAAALVRQYMRERPDSADGHALLAFIFFKQKKWKDSMGEYVETARLRDLTASELKTFGLSCAQLQMYSDAEKWLSRSIEMDPADAKSWEARGHLRVEQQHYEDAISDFGRSLRLAPKTVSAQTGIGLSFEFLTRLDKAVLAYKTAISWQVPGPGEDPAPLHALGRVLLKLNKPEEALPYLRRAVARGPDIAQAHEELARAYASLGQYTAAQGELEKAILLAPKVARFHFTLGQLYRKTGMLDKAKAELALYDNLVGTHSTPDVDPR
jgi:tetratricopeptide (TPR) repeat protein